MITHQNSVFIDPKNCGSNVGYYIVTCECKRKDKPTTYSFCGTVVLTNCSHKIDWTFGGDYNGGVEKIDKAISMLQEFRNKYLETEKSIAKLNK